MKYKVFLVVSFLLAILPSRVSACGYAIFDPQNYRMFRISPNYLRNPSELPQVQYNYAAGENCLLWKQQTGTDALPEDIYQVVYKYSLEELSGLLSQTGGDTTHFMSLNPFVATLRKDSEAKDILLLAKQCESLRNDMNSAWYYPTKNDPYRLSLDEVARKTMAYSGARFRSRYALQAVRALLSLRRYNDCINYWESVGKRLDDDVVSRMALRYVAGAYYNLGETAKAKSLYGQAGDTDALFRCAEREGEDAMETIYAFYPDAPVLRDWVERKILTAELDAEGFSGEERDNAFLYKPMELSADVRAGLKKLRQFCVRAGSEGRVSDPALWYYSAAFIDHLLGDNVKASKVLTLAERSNGTAFIRESIRVFRIYLDALNTPWSTSYASRMVDRLRWLDEKIVNNIDLCDDFWPMFCINTNRSFYYWNDMMRKIVLSAISPKLMKYGQFELALGFANMAANRTLQLYGSGYQDSDGNSLSMDAYRQEDGHNEHDWRNALFEMLDSSDLDGVIRYLRMIENPVTETERYLCSRGYTNPAYFRDIIGTRLLREMRYGEAEKWLSSVPASFTKQLNTCMYRDPFSLTFRHFAPITYVADFKYYFASEMASLERSILSTPDPDRKALLLLRYATGMKSSITHCWSLTFYGKHWYDTDPSCEPTRFALARKKILDRADDLFREAEIIARSDAVKAQIQLALGNTRTVMEQYAGTSAAASIRGRCDTYYDYHLDKDPDAGYGTW